MKYRRLLELLLKLIVLHTRDGDIAALCNWRYLRSHRVDYSLCSFIETLLRGDHGVTQPGGNLVITDQVVVRDQTPLLLNAYFMRARRLFNLAKLVHEGAVARL